MDETAQFQTPTNISLIPINPSQIPPENVLMAEAQALLNGSRSWQAGKTYPKAKTFLHKEFDPATKKSQLWHCIVSELRKDEISFNKIWPKLGKNKLWNQRSYVTNIGKVTRIKYLSEWQSIWTVSITYPPPMSPRVFTVYQASTLLEYSHRRRGIVITLPIDLASKSNEDLAELEEEGVKGRYVAVEHLQEVDGDMIEWRRVVSVDSGGSIPKCWARRHAERRMVEENVRCIEWLKTLKQEETNEEERQEEFPQRDSIGSLNVQSTKESTGMFHYQDDGTNTETMVG